MRIIFSKGPINAFPKGKKYMQRIKDDQSWNKDFDSGVHTVILWANWGGKKTNGGRVGFEPTKFFLIILYLKT